MKPPSNTSQRESSPQSIVFDGAPGNPAMEAKFFRAIKSLEALSIVLERLRIIYVILYICEMLKLA